MALDVPPAETPDPGGELSADPMNYTLILPDQTEALTNFYMLATAIFREARSEDQLSKLAVGWVIRNRVNHGGWYGGSYFDVIIKRAQFTSFSLGDKNSIMFGGPKDPAWRECVQAATDVLLSNRPDPTNGALFYYDRSMDDNPPLWSKEYTHTVDIGAFHFYKPSPSA